MDGNYISSVVLRKPLDAGSYLRRLPAVQALIKQGSLHFNRAVTFLVGENGSGKSTLLEAIAVAHGFNPEGGTKNFNFSTRRSHSPLCDHLTLVKRRHPRDGFFLRAESFYNVASNIDDLDGYPARSPHVIDSYGGVSLHEQSHGESFLALVQHRFGGKGLYILDEPEAALSPAKLLLLMAELDALVRRDSQFIIATHSPMLMTFPGADIYQLSERGIESVTYEQTEHFQLTRRFLDNPERMLRRLLDTD